MGAACSSSQGNVKRDRRAVLTVTDAGGIDDRSYINIQNGPLVDDILGNVFAFVDMTRSQMSALVLVSHQWLRIAGNDLCWDRWAELHYASWTSQVKPTGTNGVWTRPLLLVALRYQLKVNDDYVPTWNGVRWILAGMGIWF